MLIGGRFVSKVGRTLRKRGFSRALSGRVRQSSFCRRSDGFASHFSQRECRPALGLSGLCNGDLGLGWCLVKDVSSESRGTSPAVFSVIASAVSGEGVVVTLYLMAGAISVGLGELAPGFPHGFTLGYTVSEFTPRSTKKLFVRGHKDRSVVLI